MSRYKKILISGGVIFLSGLVLLIYVYSLPAYGAYSGAGMSGLPAAFMMMAALFLMALGAVIAAGNFIIHLVLKRVNAGKE